MIPVPKARPEPTSQSKPQPSPTPAIRSRQCPTIPEEPSIASSSSSFHNAPCPRPGRPHKHSAYHNLRSGQWEYRLCRCNRPERHGDAWEIDFRPCFLDKFGQWITWSELCERVLDEVGRDEVTMQEYVEMLPRLLERGAAEREARKEAETDLVVALGGTVCLCEWARSVG